MKLFSVIFTAAVLPLVPLQAQMLPTASPKDVGLSQERLDRIGAFLNDHIAKGDIVGAIALVARQGKVAYSQSFGMMDKEAKKPMAKDAIFRMFSMTKPMIAVTALTLYEQGKFSLMDPVSKYIPEFKDMKVAVVKTDPATGQKTFTTVPAEKPILVVDLFRHTWGQTNAGPRNEKGEAIFNRASIRDRSLAEGIPVMAKVPLVHQPEAYWDYSEGPDVIGRLIEIWSGKPLDVYVKEALTTPLHMVDTDWWVPADKWSRVATVYRGGGRGQGGPAVRESQAVQEQWIKSKPVYLEGSGGMVSTLTDYTRFAQMLLNGGELDGVRILSPKTVELMSSDLLGDIPYFAGPLPPGHGFGLTVAVDRGPAKTATIGTEGEYFWEGADGTDFFVDPKEKMIFVYMIQEPGGALMRDVKRIVYQSIVK
jgi:CubicO group peptidase (beta-lactamase class C family)